MCLSGNNTHVTHQSHLGPWVCLWVSESNRCMYLIASLQVLSQLLMLPLCGVLQGNPDKPMQAQPQCYPRLHRQTKPSSCRQRQLHQEGCSQQMRQRRVAHCCLMLQGVKLMLMLQSPPQRQLLQWHLQLSSTQQAQSGMSWR